MATPPASTPLSQYWVSAPRPPLPAQLWGERWGFMLSYWGLFGGVNVPLDNWVYHGLNGLAIAGVIGVAIYFITPPWRWFRQGPRHSWRDFVADLSAYIQSRAPLLLVGLFGVMVVALLTQWASVTWSSQGRLVFSAIATWSIFLALGVATVATQCFARHSPHGMAQCGSLLAGIAVFMFGVSALAPFTTIACVCAIESAVVCARARLRARCDVW